MDKSAMKITVTYDDGTVKELEKGLVFHLEDRPAEEQVQITAEMVALSGQDLFTIVTAAVDLGMKLGMFEETEGIDNEES